MRTEPILLLADARRLTASGEARRIRQAADLAIADVARTVGVDRATVSRWESGHRKPSGPAAARYARLLRLLIESTGVPA
jgi:DNA-binding transcriptional regulator YiaG